MIALFSDKNYYRAAIVLFQFFLLVMNYSSPLFAQGEYRGTTVSTLLRNAADQSVKHCTADIIDLEIYPPEYPIVLQIFSDVLIQSGKSVRKAEASGNQKIIVDVRELKYSTDLFMDSMYLGMSRMNIGVVIENMNDKKIMWSHEFIESRVDTVKKTSDISFVNLDTQKKNTFFESIMEPVLISIAAIVIVILLFTVRGS